MAFLIIATEIKVSSWVKHLSILDPGIDIRIWPEVDHIMRDPDLPAGVPVTRVVAPSMAQSMSEYAVLGVLNYCRQFDSYRADRGIFVDDMTYNVNMAAEGSN